MGRGEMGINHVSGRDVTKRELTDVNPIVSGRNYDI